MPIHRSTPPGLRGATLAGLLGSALLVLALPAAAQYKVVGPDGRVTYTDRPVAPPPGGQVQSLRAGVARLAATAPASTGPALPLDLRTVASRFPVTLYTTAECAPCDSGRSLLRQRGIPYTERQVLSDEDASLLQRLTGGRTLPTLTVGGQALRGLQADDWSNTLDLAGYPKDSRLPPGWAPPAATPLARAVASAAPATPAAARNPEPAAEPPAEPARPAPAPAPAPEPADEPPTPGRIRF